MPVEFADQFAQSKRPVARFANFLLENLVFQKEQQKAAEEWHNRLVEMGFKE